MKISQLLEDTYDDARQRSAAFKELAAKYGLRIDGGQALPAFTKEGVWYGGGFYFKKRGVNKNEVVSAEDLGMDVMFPAFLEDLAKELEALAAQGHAIKVAGAARGKDVKDAPAGKILQALQQAVVTAIPPGNVKASPYKSSPAKTQCVMWFVSTPAELAGTEVLRIDFSAGAKDGTAKDARITLAASLDARVAKQAHKKLGGWVQAQLKAAKASGKPSVELLRFLNNCTRLSERYGSPSQHLPAMDAAWMKKGWFYIHAYLKTKTKDTITIKPLEMQVLLRDIAA